MVTEKLKAPTLRDLFVERIREQILSGELEVGEKLPTERELAEGMEVSRQVVNSGIAELERQGFIRVVPRHGTYVADFRREGDLSTLSAIMEYRGADIRDEEIRSILEVRWGLEHLTLRNAIEHATDEDIKTLEQHLEELRTAKTPEQAADAAFTFQHAMAMIGKNTVLPLIYVSFRTVVTTLWKRFVVLYGVEALYHNTKTTYDHLRERDFEKAVAWLDHFMNEAIEGEQQIYQRNIAK